MKYNNMICNPSECTGCFACESVCPKNAITIGFDQRGFYKPYIDEKCINCNKCVNICPVNNPPKLNGPTKVWAFQSNSSIVRFNSTSGGFFNALATKVIENDGVVCGAGFTSEMRLIHLFVDNKDNLDKLQRSKYVQSSLNDVFSKIKNYLREGKKVLFVGLGCQAAAVRKIIGYHNNLIIVDLVCYGVPSTGLFEDWVNYIEGKYGKIVDVRFRDKSYGYATPNVKVIFDNGNSIESCRDANLFTELFFKHYSTRNSCYACHFKTINRSSDITLGDLWTINNYIGKLDNDAGFTCVFAHTEKGMNICQKLCTIELDLNYVVNHDGSKLVNNVSPAKGVGDFWKIYEEEGFVNLTNKYIPDSLKSRMKYFIKNVMNKTGISKKWYKWKVYRDLS